MLSVRTGVRSFLSRTHWLCEIERAPVSTQARAKSGAAAHVRLERRAKGWSCRFIYFLYVYIFCNAVFPLPALDILQVSPDSFFLFRRVGCCCCCKRPVNPSEQGGGGVGGGCAHSLYFTVTSFSKNSRMPCSRAPAQWSLLHCSMQQHSAHARDKKLFRIQMKWCFCLSKNWWWKDHGIHRHASLAIFVQTWMDWCGQIRIFNVNKGHVFIRALADVRATLLLKTCSCCIITTVGLYYINLTLGIM